MINVIPSSHSTPYLQQILKEFDQLTESLGLNVPTIVEMDKPVGWVERSETQLYSHFK